MNNIRNENVHYLSDEELEKLIAMTEAEPMLHPPGEFKNDILRQIRHKREYRKNLRLFSYSVKVFAATAAALTIMLIAPENISSEDAARNRRMQADMAEDAANQRYDGSFMYRLNEKMDDYCSQLNNRLNELVEMEDD